MANKKISELESRASLSLSDLMAVGDPSTGYLYKTTISDLKTLTGAGVVSFNGRFGTVNPAEGDYTLTQLGDVIITSAANGDVLKYNGSNWVNTQLYTGTVAQYIDGTGAYQTFPTLLSSDRLVTNVRNTSGATITKGTVVYLNGSSGTLPTIAKAQANAESTSTGTYGVVQDNIANNANGYVVVIGNLTALDTSAYNAGDILWLSPTVAGGYTTTKPVAPNHAVYVGIVTRSSNTQGTIEVKIQNGYELDELHNVLITSVANNDVLVYETASSLWKNKAFSTLSTDTLDSVTGRGNTTANSITVGSVSAAGLSNLLGQIRTFVTTGNTYIGANPGSATDAGFKLDVNGTTRLNGATSVTGVLTGSDTIRSTNGTVTVSISYGSTAGIIGTTSNHSLEIRTNNTYRVGVSTAGVVNVSNLAGTGSRIVVADAAGNLSASSALTGYVTLDTAQTITGEKTFSTAIAAVGGISLRDTVGGSNYGGIIANSSYFQISAQGGSGILIKASDGTNALTIGTTGNTTMTNVTATSFIKSGGTSSQFLKADGSVDSNTYLTSASVSGVYLPLSGGTLTGGLVGTTATFTGNIKKQNSGGTVYTELQTDGVYATATDLYLLAPSGKFVSIYAGGAEALKIASTGAATFSSSVSTGGDVFLRTTGAVVFNSAANFNTQIYHSSGSLVFYTGGNERVTIASNGAATFSSTVTATQFIVGSATTSTDVSIRFKADTGDFSLITDRGSHAFGIYDHQVAVYRMYVNSSGFVGIGTTAPTGELHVYGSTTAFRLQSSVSGNMQMGQWDGTNNRIQSSGRNFLLIGTDAYSTIFGTNGVKRLEIGADGNFAMGNFSPSGTPPSDYLSFEIGRQGNTISAAPWKSNLYLSTNATITAGSTTFTYRNSGVVASLLSIEGGAMSFSNAPSGTAGVGVSWTPVMTLDAGGRLLLGTTSNVNNVRVQVAPSDVSWISATFGGTGNSDKVVIGNFLGPTIGGHNSTLTAWSTLAINPDGGNVMIGKTGDDGTAKLQVNGSIKTSSPTDGTAQPWKFGEATNTLYTATRTVKVEINGALYYLLAVASSDL